MSCCSENVNSYRRPGLRIDVGSARVDGWHRPASEAPASQGPSTIRSTSSTPQNHKEASDPQLIRRKAFSLRSGHRNIIRDQHKAVALCGLTPLRGPGGEPSQALLVAGKGGANVSGLMRCANPWSCPCCAPKLAAKRAAILGPQVAAHVRNGGTCFLITFTISHSPHDTLSELFAGIGRAWSRTTSGRVWHNLRQEGGIEYIRGYDVTFGENGWHPHAHMVLLIDPEHETPVVVAHAILDRWLAACKSLGLKVSRLGQDVQQAKDEREATAYAVAPAAVYEAGAMALKRSRGQGKGVTPFEILADAVTERAKREALAKERGVEILDVAEGRLERLWREYVAATKGLRQLTTSRGLSMSDDDLADENVEDVEPLVELGSASIGKLDRELKMSAILDCAEITTDDPMDRLRRLEAFLVENVCAPTSLRCDWSVLWPTGSMEAFRDAAIRQERAQRLESQVPL